MKSSRLPIVVCVFLMATMLALVGTKHSPTVLAENSDLPSWVDVQPEISKREDLSAEQFVKEARDTQCEEKTVHEWGYNPGLGNKLDYNFSGCLVGMGSGYYDVNNKSIVAYGSDRLQRLKDPISDDIRQVIILPAAGTNKLAMVYNAYYPFSNGGAKLRLVDDWATVFPPLLTRDGYSNIERTRTLPYDYELKDQAGNYVEIRPQGVKFSSNGEWLQVLARDKAHLMLNTKTHEIIPYADASETNYGIYSAVSNNGQYVATTRDLNSFKIYDTRKCQANQGEFVSRNCQSIELKDDDGFLTKYLGSNDYYIEHVEFVGMGDALDVNIRKQDANNNWTYATYRLKIPGQTPTKYLALGDSFSSGQGAYEYRAETNFYIDDSNYNVCHQSYSSYPYLLQSTAHFDDFGSVACSGAQSKDLFYLPAHAPSSHRNYTDISQAKEMPTTNFDNEIYSNFLPGYREQSNFVNKTRPSVVTLGIGGNDAGFSQIIISCITDIIDCYSEPDERYLLSTMIDANTISIEKTIRNIQQNMPSNGKIYLVGYPETINPSGFCEANVQINQRERLFAQNLTRYLNYSLQKIAAETGASYIDISKAFYGDTFDYRLCGISNKRAVNGITNNKISARNSKAFVDDESFHPNKFGHELIATSIGSKTNNLQNEIYTSYDSTINEELRRTLIDNNTFTPPTNPGIVLDYNDAIGTGLFIINQITTVFDDIGDNLKRIASQPASSTVTAELHSSPVVIGNLNITQEGIISGAVQIPDNMTPGYHQLHYKIPLIDGKILDIFKIVYVAHSTQDYDGDGVLNVADPCPASGQSLQDKDKDGIDDACDGEISEPVLIPASDEQNKPVAMITQNNTALNQNNFILKTEPPLSSIFGPADVPIVIDQANTFDSKTSKINKQADKSRSIGIHSYLWQLLLLITFIAMVTSFKVVMFIKRQYDK